MAPRKRILFVCTENANRSQMAEAFARMLAGDRVEAMSAGSRPSGSVSPKAVLAMKEVGYDLSSHRSKSLSELPAGDLDVVVSMGCGDACPLVPARAREEWQIPDPREMQPDEVRTVRDEIRRRVEDLLRRL